MGRFRPLLGLLVCVGLARADEPLIDSVMDRDPLISKASVERTFRATLLPLWLEALERPEADHRCRAALTIAQAHERGMKGLEAAVEPLLRELKRPGQHASVRLAAARALVTLDVREAAAALSQAAANDTEVSEIVQPALSRWDFKPARADWLDQLKRPPHGRPTLLAIQSLAAVKETAAVEPLRTLVLDNYVPAAIRLQAARALGQLQRSGSESFAADAGQRGTTNRLIAVSLLRHHSGVKATRQLVAMAGDTEPAVAAVALERLVEIDPELVVPLVDKVLAVRDAKVRSFGVETLFRRPSDAHIRKVGDRFVDADPAIRSRARDVLRELAAKAEWRELVLRETTRMLAGTDWRGQEQGALLAAQLGHKPAADRLVQLLKEDRLEVVVSAAWGLRKLAIPETLPAILEYMKDQHRRMVANGPTGGRKGLSADAIDRQFSQLGQFIGQTKFRPAEELLRQFLPPFLGPPKKGELSPTPNPAGPEARTAAYWALGMMHENDPVPEIVRACNGRLNAIFPPDTEHYRVRRMAAITLGRMKAKDGLTALREFYPAKNPSLDLVNNACGWAIERITGEPMPSAGRIGLEYRDWFLEPRD